MKKYFCFVIVFLFLVRFSSAQDSTLTGRIALSAFLGYSISNGIEEQSNGAAITFLRFFPTPKHAMVISLQSIRSAILRGNVNSTANNYSIGFGYERYFLLGKLAPYVGLEAGINVITIKSSFIKSPSNEGRWDNDLPNYLFKPKAGLQYNLNDKLHFQLEGTYNWVLSVNPEFTNILNDDQYKPVFFGRKIPMLSFGVLYKFAE